MTDGDLASDDGWRHLRRFTDARIGLGRAGHSLPTARHLEFQLAHARARDAVTRDVDWATLRDALPPLARDPVMLHSRAATRAQYLQRPDLGRALDTTSQERLDAALAATGSAPDTCVVLADGLSATAVESGGPALLAALLPALSRAPFIAGTVVCAASQARVALGDAIATRLGVRHCVMIIGERPGLSSPDSLGIYYTHVRPGAAQTDADRNCLSNIRPRGLSREQAVEKLLWLMTRAEELGFSGVRLKDSSADTRCLAGEAGRNFLLGPAPAPDTGCGEAPAADPGQ